MTYRVKWEIDIEADSPFAAAREALRIQRDTESTATVFIVGRRQIDLQRECPGCDLDCKVCGVHQPGAASLDKHRKWHYELSRHRRKV